MHWELVYCSSCCLYESSRNVMYSQNPFRLTHINWLWFKMFITFNQDWNEICDGSRVGLVVLMLSIPVFTQCNVLTGTIHVDSHWFIVIQDVFSHEPWQEWHLYCIQGYLVVLKLSIRVFTQCIVLARNIYVDSHRFIVIQDVLRLQKNFSSL